ncbi:hypothetical protein P691DRAFT_843373 [Macrolepiota fuliginosa MF-IS2]|uniref:Uncharacterized protein n=1 Tax=Macrolepiota fuliginosa MF-IS2 TaxID=1400762 RepID=A0A9P5X3B4_9AGAR|nr:hypothetical protein P691DRAFT_843373 [Macrolepiota fuliginosa MF-IS2]
MASEQARSIPNTTNAASQQVQGIVLPGQNDPTSNESVADVNNGTADAVPPPVDSAVPEPVPAPSDASNAAARPPSATPTLLSQPGSQSQTVDPVVLGLFSDAAQAAQPSLAPNAAKPKIPAIIPGFKANPFEIEASGFYGYEASGLILASGLIGSIWLAALQFAMTFEQHLAECPWSLISVTCVYARLMLGPTAIPKNVDCAFENFNYVPYPALSHSACLNALEGKEDFIINALGGISVKGLD